MSSLHGVIDHGCGWSPLNIFSCKAGRCFSLLVITSSLRQLIKSVIHSSHACYHLPSISYFIH